ncbi:DUF1254 domain-containing protein [Pseudomonas sp. JQ170]|uniref:DUF1254 domain-containing protein n=1 Tax=unclassified Pseudomonas TaxID=196821 RepID=UPI002654FD1A|nr:MULTISPECIES: DUF1254 domain-containing protein [unclassified Pseudomonas]MDN7139849.1 DUF1254 domain-containing protein [Pseudomonas sp. JQ170]WRO73697.1 DUF1254 domain-containing protein [Pseudomonas sp. 170C]
MPNALPFSRALATLLCLAPLCAAQAQSLEAPYVFNNGFPTRETVQRVYDDVDLNRALQSYRFFYPNVAMMHLWNANLALGQVPNKVFTVLQGTPKKRVFTANSDTPYAGLMLDLSNGPMVVELPKGPIMSVANDLNQRWVADLGLPGPDKGQGGKFLFLPPGYQGSLPQGYYTATPTTQRLLVMLRALPKDGLDAAIALMKSVKVYPLHPPADWPAAQWIDQAGKSSDISPISVENTLQYWRELHELINNEPALPEYRNYYGELAALGIAKGKPFAPDSRMQEILIEAAQRGNAQMRVQSLADRRSDRLAWPDRQWEWAVLRPENGSFEINGRVDLEAREKWFYQAMIASPAMFRREPGAGSLYWLGSRDAQGAFLDGSKTYRLKVPQPVPAKLFWSVTVYDSETRSQIENPQNQAALRSMIELQGLAKEGVNELYFGPSAPPGHEKQWIKTSPGKGWFTYFRIYGPEAMAFNGEWKPGDFEEVK